MNVRRLSLVLAALSLWAALVDPWLGLSDVASADARHTRSRHHGHHRHPSRSHRSRRPAPPARARVTPAYRRMVASWHAPPPAALRRAWLAKRVPPLVLRPLGAPHPISLEPDAHGRFGEEALALARRAFRYGATGAHHEIEPRLLALCYRAVRRFKTPYVTLVSGYRERKATSRHDQGRAMDIALPGVSNERLAAFLRPQGFVGVGVYPVSGFVHLDVRARSYFWIDRSGPSEPSRTQATNANLVSRYDTDARRRGERPVADVVASASESDEGGASLEVPPAGRGDDAEETDEVGAEPSAPAAPDARSGDPATGLGRDPSTPGPDVALPVGAIAP